MDKWSACQSCPFLRLCKEYDTALGAPDVSYCVARCFEDIESGDKVSGKKLAFLKLALAARRDT